MTAIVDASETALGHQPLIGYIVLPHNTTILREIFDDVLHYDFPCYGYARRGDDVHLDIVRHRKAAQYAYQIPWKPLHSQSTKSQNDRHRDMEAEEDAFFLLANFEPDFLELAGGCVHFACDSGDLVEPRAWPELGEDALWAAGTTTLEEASASPGRRSGDMTTKLADAITFYMELTDPDRSSFRGIVITGAASDRAMAALRFALHDALPFVNKTHFYDSVPPASVFSLGAALIGRNRQLGDEWHDCECIVDEDLRCPGGKRPDPPWNLPFDNEFPCNRSLVIVDEMYY